MGFPFDYMDTATVTVHPTGNGVVSVGLHPHGQAHAATFPVSAPSHEQFSQVFP